MFGARRRRAEILAKRRIKRLQLLMRYDSRDSDPEFFAVGHFIKQDTRWCAHGRHCCEPHLKSRYKWKGWRKARAKQLIRMDEAIRTKI